MEKIMTNYIIEGTISELSFDESYFTICGAEGFSIKQNDKKYNVLCPKAMPESEKSLEAIVLAQDFKFPTGENKDLLLQAVSSQKRIKVQLCIEDNQIETYIDLNKLIEKKKIVVSLLSN